MSSLFQSQSGGSLYNSSSMGSGGGGGSGGSLYGSISGSGGSSGGGGSLGMSSLTNNQPLQLNQLQPLSNNNNITTNTTTTTNNNEQNKQYVPSRIFTQERADLMSSTDKRKITPDVLTTSPTSHMMQSPTTPYNHSFRGGASMMTQSPSDSFRFRSSSVGGGIGAVGLGMYQSQQNQQQHQQQVIDRDYIPRASIYDEPATSHGAMNQPQSNTTFSGPSLSLFDAPVQHSQPSSSSLHLSQHSVFPASSSAHLQTLAHNLQQQLSALQQQAATQPSTLLQSQIQQTQHQLIQVQQQQQQQHLQQPALTASALQTSQSPPIQQQQQQLALYQSNSPYYAPAVDAQLYSEKYDKRWLTIFGFPLSASDLVLDEVGGLATIVETKYPSNNTANWIHIKLENEAIANDLLTKNGLIIGNYMIGVTSYKDITKSTPLPAPTPQPPFKELETYAPSRSNYDPSEYLNNSTTQPSRPSIMSKISEYVFGI